MAKIQGIERLGLMTLGGSVDWVPVIDPADDRLIANGYATDVTAESVIKPLPASFEGFNDGSILEDKGFPSL